MACLPAGRYTLMYFVYVLQSLKTGEYYKGITNDIDRRMHEHFSGRSKFTKNKLPLRIIQVEICKDRKTAREMEKFFKSGYGREIISEIADLY